MLGFGDRPPGPLFRRLESLRAGISRTVSFVCATVPVVHMYTFVFLGRACLGVQAGVSVLRGGLVFARRSGIIRHRAEMTGTGAVSTRVHEQASPAQRRAGYQRPNHHHDRHCSEQHYSHYRAIGCLKPMMQRTADAFSWVLPGSTS